MRRFFLGLSKFLYIWLLTVFLLGLTLMTSYVLVQQEGRTSINAPLIQMAQTVEAELKSGVSVSEILRAPSIDLSISQSPFITLYSLDKKIIGSGERLGNQSLSLPVGVLNHARVNGEAKITWQPTKDLRFASVTDYVANFGYVSVSQSLRETEARASRARWLVLIAIGCGSGVSGVVLWFLAKYRRGEVT